MPVVYFVGGNRAFVLQRQPNAVQTVQQHAVAAEVVDFKAVALPPAFTTCASRSTSNLMPDWLSPEQTASSVRRQGYRQQLVVKALL